MNNLSNQCIEQTIDIVQHNLHDETKKLYISDNNVRMIVFNEIIKYGLHNIENSNNVVSQITKNTMDSIVFCMYDKNIM